MDDFLHLLRSGKLKQQDRRKDYYGDQQYKGTQRRGPMDRRKMGSDNIELIDAIKDALQSVNEEQNRVAAAHEALAKSKERQARAIETIADNFHGLFYRPYVKSNATVIPETFPAAVKESPEAPGPSQSKAQDEKVKKLTASTKMTIFNLTRGMRDNGDAWAKIARAIAAKGYPTVSGKGQWRGDMVKNLYEKMAQS